MEYSEFEKVISRPRLNRYLYACGGDSRKAMTLYRYNIKLSQEMFTIISCFEVALRNRINNLLLNELGPDWLQNSVRRNGIFTNYNFRLTAEGIREAIRKLGTNYNHSRLVAELGFGFWRYMFARQQYRATGRVLLRIFPSKPTSTPTTQYNQNYIFNQLADVNKIRNRIAHHEPICFQIGHSLIDTTNIQSHYVLIKTLFNWMDIDTNKLLYGLDHVDQISRKINVL